MIYQPLVDVLQKLGVKQGDILCVSSDIAKLGIPAEVKPLFRTKGMQALTDTYIQTLLSVVGESGTLIMPTFTYSACEGQVFDVNNTASTVGMLTEAFRHYPGTVRNEHPIFSFAIHGKLGSELSTMETFDCFGKHSLYDKLHALEAKYLLLGVNMWQGSTYVYYSEQKHRVPYRYMKNFEGTIVDGTLTKNVTTPYFVRDYAVGYEDAWECLQQESLEQGITQTAPFLAGKVLIHDAVAIDQLIQAKLANNPEYLIRYV